MFGTLPRRRCSLTLRSTRRLFPHSPSADLGTFPFAEFRSFRAWEAFALALRVRFTGAPLVLAWPGAAREAVGKGGEGPSRRVCTTPFPPSQSLPSRPPAQRDVSRVAVLTLRCGQKLQAAPQQRRRHAAEPCPHAQPYFRSGSVVSSVESGAGT